MTGARGAVFLDRDGVLNAIVERGGRPESPRELAEFVLVAEARDSVRRLRAAGLPVFVVTNQPDVARGLLPAPALEAMMRRLTDHVGVDDTRVCPHEDRHGCACRKPAPGMILELAEHWGVDTGQSFMVGDTWRDMDAGRAAGCRTVLLRTWYNDDADGDMTVSDLGEAVDRILAAHADGGAVSGRGPADGAG
ncbi:MAG TPA: HAD-IIIA family hydrolase [Longimicrobiales bacterium]|nr:HAD-IIIA family hydrolase [Longimicrobiales bacterium]